MIKKKLNNLVEVISESFKQEIESFPIEKLVSLWNRFREDEYDGSDTMFNLNNKNDVIFLLQNTTANIDTFCEIRKLYLSTPDLNTSYFCYNSSSLVVIPLTKRRIYETILSFIEDIVECFLKCGFVEEYKFFYQHYVYDNFIKD